MTFNRALFFKTAEVGGGSLPFLGPFNAGADLSTTSSIQVKFFAAIQGGVVRANRRSPIDQNSPDLSDDQQGGKANLSQDSSI